MMKGETNTTAIQHATLMAEKSKIAEDNFVDISDASNSVELDDDIRPWRANDTKISAGGGRLGSAAHPIEIDDDISSWTSQAGARRDGNVTGTDKGLRKHVVHEWDLSPGDQIYAYRGAIQHHGIVTYVPWARGTNGMPGAAPHLSPGGVHVVHFDSCCDGVETTSLEAFLKGGILRKAMYSASKWSASFDFGASYACAADDPAVIVMRATEAARFGEGISGWSGYSILTNNCETFAFWCCTGRRQTLSRQASRGLAGAGLVAAGVSAVATLGGLTSAGATATAQATSMIPSSLSGAGKTIRGVQWAAGVAVAAITAADAVSHIVTREPVARNCGGNTTVEH